MHPHPLWNRDRRHAQPRPLLLGVRQEIDGYVRRELTIDHNIPMAEVAVVQELIGFGFFT